jgi:hypothetical protein
LGYLGVVDARVDGSQIRFVPLVFQVVIRWGEMWVKVIEGNEALPNEESGSKV